MTLSIWAGVLFVAGVLVLLFEIGGRNRPIVRAGSAALCIAVCLRYIYWRFHYSLPHQQNALQALWSYFFLIIEMGALSRALLTCFFLSRTVDRSAVADMRQSSPLLDAPTDVFIATYNESFEILERTAVAALTIEHPDLRVWLLDDGNRPWVHQLATSLGIHYVSRNKGKHAKAGNINNGVGVALSTGRRPDFFLLLDADFAASRSILRRTLGLFEDKSVGIVQTPQHFFNPDPIQSKFSCASVWPDEQRLFFNFLMPSKDAWGACFCCGTSAVFRVAAFEEAGGMAIETVTEDMLTTFKFGEFGYRTIYLNERLSLGLSPESVTDYVSQRSRWCLGTIQQIFTRWSFFGRARITLVNRLSFLDGILFWIFGAVYRVMLLIAPILWWLTGTASIHASLPEIVRWMGPSIVADALFMGYISGGRTLPIIGDVTQVLSAFVICRTVATTLVRPFGRAFKVTAKGLSTTGITVQWRLLWPFVLLAVLGAGSMLPNVSRYSPAHGSNGYPMCILWTLVNTTILTITALICVEVPHRRLHERFASAELAEIALLPMFSEANSEAPASKITCNVRNLSVSGASLSAAAGWDRLCGPARLVIKGNGTEELSLPFTVVERRDDRLAIHFHSEPWIRHALIRKLFTGDYHHEVLAVRPFRIACSMLKVVFFSKPESPVHVGTSSGQHVESAQALSLE